MYIITIYRCHFCLFVGDQRERTFPEQDKLMTELVQYMCVLKQTVPAVPTMNSTTEEQKKLNL